MVSERNPERSALGEARLIGRHIFITGIVQGVGFRPFVYGLAVRLALNGWVRNTSAGVDIGIDGTPEAIEQFLRALRAEAPPLARVDGVRVEPCAPSGYTRFEIIHSEAPTDAFQPIPPDAAICDACLRELFDPGNRRYRYPFINCTHCGPRFTIIQDLPYDRPLTTMARFEMCADCAWDYADPLDRRFHAQPVACPKCGPQVWLEMGGVFRGEEAIQTARQLLTAGRIVAVKGLGGFHLACDAANSAAVAELRRRKLRVDKPFALMMPDLASVEAHCLVSPAERELLLSHERPIVILRRRPGSSIAREVAPGQDSLGVMLPYTPLHYLLFDRGPGTQDGYSPDITHFSALVMTSGNLSEEPIAIDNEEAHARLSSLADAFLMHDRDIHTRCDDSVVRIFAAGGPAIYPLRRSRGYTPFPVKLPFDAPPTLAAGGELKNTFCVTRGDYAFLSHHIGDLENYETLRSFEEGVAHFERLFRVRPELIAHDLHPDYLATRYALERAEREDLRAVGVQHHHAHIAACMAEHGLTGERRVIGVAFDGTGYGTDGAIWGGEFLVTDYCGFQRAAHLAYVLLPGGDTAVRNPFRTALSYLQHAAVEWSDDLAPVRAATGDQRSAISQQLKTGLNAPLTSSMGRLFDAVAALAGGRQSVNYEAQAAIEFESCVDCSEAGVYPFDFDHDQIDPAPVLRAIVADVRARMPIGQIAARFHNGVAEMVGEVCRSVRERTGLGEVALSGGVWQNMTLLGQTVALLRQAGFTVYVHQQVPANDGGLALGQAAIAIRQQNC